MIHPNKTVRTGRYTTLFGLLSVAGVVVWCWLLFQAGCAGDPQNPGQGDPVRAQAFERTASPFLILSVAAGLGFIISLKHFDKAKRVAWGTRLVLFGLPIAWVAGLQFEQLALRICF